MASKFAPGATVHNKDGRVYIVDMVEDGVVYCRTDGGAETEFAEAALFTEAEWAAKSGGRREQFYARLKQSKTYAQAAAAHADDAASAGILLVERAQGAAGESGIQRGDLILGVNGKRTRSLKEFRDAVAQAGKVVALLVQRGDQQVFIPVRPG